jgi:hypothetical protein
VRALFVTKRPALWYCPVRSPAPASALSRELDGTLRAVLCRPLRRRRRSHMSGRALWYYPVPSPAPYFHHVPDEYVQSLTVELS